MTKRRVPNVVRGGAAIPLKGKANYYYMTGRKHTNGGIDIGQNAKTGIEVEDGEVMHITDNEVKVFSAVPFLNGESPAQKVIRGENPNKVFNEQELFKKVNKIKDDGSKKKRMGGDDIDLNGLSTTRNRPYNVKNLLRMYNSLDTVPYLGDIQRAALLGSTVEESGADPGAIDSTGKYKGLLQWEKSRFPNVITGNDEADIDNQLNENIYKTIRDTTDRKSWTHGGKGSGYKTAKEARDAFMNAKTVREATHALNRGYIRPTGKDYSVENRTKVAEQIYDRIVKHNSQKTKEKPSFIRKIKNKINEMFGTEFKYGGDKKHGGSIYSVTDKGKTRHYMIPSTGNASARSAEVRTKKFLGGNNKDVVTTPVKFTEPNPNLNLPKTIAPISTKVVPQKSNGAKDWWADNKSNIISDGIGLVSNIAGSLISHSINKKMLNNLKPAPQPIARQATKLKTQININPQLDKMRETVAAYERNIDNNTSSSNVALARKQNARLANTLNTNEFYGTKENIETELINKDRLNQQAVSEKNVTDYNKWSTDVANFKNTILEQKANNDVSLVNNLNAGVQNMLTIRDKRNAEKQTIAAMALANPNLPIEMFYEQGLIKKKLYDSYRKAYPNKTTTNGTTD